MKIISRFAIVFTKSCVYQRRWQWLWDIKRQKLWKHSFWLIFLDLWCF